MQANLKALKDFIKNEKRYFNEHLIRAVCGHNWDEEVWVQSGIKNENFLVVTGGFRLSFFSTRMMKGFNDISIDKEYQNFCKAFMVYLYRKEGRPSIQKLIKALLNMKKLYVVMVELRGLHSPLHLETAIFEEVDKRVIESTKSDPHNVLSDLAKFQRLLRPLGICLYELTYTNKHKCANKYNKKNKETLAQRNLKSHAVDDESRDENEKLISVEAFIALTYISNNPKTRWHQLGIRLSELLIITGFRANEVLHLPRDCWVEQDVPDRHGMPLKDSQNKIQKSYGLKYFGLKKSESRIHWIEPNAVPVAKRAIDKILEITEPYYRQALQLANNGKVIFLPENLLNRKELELNDICEYVIETNTHLIPNIEWRRVRDNVTRILKNHGVTPVRVERRIGTRGRLMDRFYSPESINGLIASAFTKETDSLHHSFKVRDHVITVGVEELLMIAPALAINCGRAARYHQTVEPTSYNQLAAFLGARSTKGRKSIFDVYEFTEADGSKIEIHTHQPRHNLNTFLALSGMAEHQQAMAMGRVSIAQNATYQHTSMAEKNKLQAEVMENKASLPSTDIYKFVDNTQLQPPLEKIKASGEMEIIPSLSLEKNLQNNFHAIDDELMDKDLMLGLLSEDVVVGELQDSFNEVKKSNSPISIEEFVDTNYHRHVVANGVCNRHVALHGCPKKMTCLSGHGCNHLHATGRAGELETALQSYERSILNLEKMKNSFGDDPNYARAIEDETHQIVQLEVFIKKAKKAKECRIPVKVFGDGKPVLGSTPKPVTLVDLYAKALDKPNKSKSLKSKGDSNGA